MNRPQDSPASSSPLSTALTPRHAARELVARFAPLRLPVPAEQICSALGIAVEFQNTASTGYSIVQGGCRAIYLPRHFSVARRRFALAHELGHVVLRHDPILPGLRNDPRERQANAFAAEFLMPEDLLRQEFLDRIALGQPTQIPLLARTFLVSRESMAIRCQELGLVESIPRS